MSVDTGLLVDQLRRHGHTVEHVIKVPDNAGDYEFIVDGVTLSLEETRALLARDQEIDGPGSPAPDPHHPFQV
jgi:hypothetical protein